MTLIALDLNSLGFAATAGTRLSAGDQPTQGIFGVLNRVRHLRETYTGRMIGLWDGRSWRYGEYPEYKANRKANPKLVELKDEWKCQRPFVAKMLRHIGVDQLSADNMEADDLAARLVRRTNDPVILVSGDKDWTALVNERVAWIDLTHKRECRLGNFEEITGCRNPWEYVQAKALCGDAGDNIPGVGGIGPVAARWIMDNSGSVAGLFNDHMLASSRDWPKKIMDFCASEEKRHAYARNLRLVWLDHPDIPAAIAPKLVRGALDRDAFIDLAAELSFLGVLSDVDGWLVPFQH